MENLNSTNSFENFNWDTPTDGADFFSEFRDTEEQTKETSKKSVGEEETKKTQEPTTEENSEEQEDLSVFSEFTDDEEEDTNNKETKGSRDSASSSFEIFHSLKEHGLLRNIELGEEEELDDDRISQLLEEDYEIEVNQRLENWALKELDDDARAFISFKQKGGDTKEFFKVLKDVNSLDGDISDEDFQRRIIVDQLRSEDWDEEEILDRIEMLENSGRLESTASKYFNRMKEKANKEKQRLIENQEKLREQAIQEKREYESAVRETLVNTKEIKGIKISPKEKAGLFNFIMSESEVSNGKKVTGFQKAILEAVNDTNKMILLAKLLKSDFDFSSLVNTVKNKEVRKLKETLESRKGLRPTNSSRNSFSTVRPLSDYF